MRQVYRLLLAVFIGVLVAIVIGVIWIWKTLYVQPLPATPEEAPPPLLPKGIMEQGDKQGFPPSPEEPKEKQEQPSPAKPGSGERKSPP